MTISEQKYWTGYYLIGVYIHWIDGNSLIVLMIRIIIIIIVLVFAPLGCFYRCLLKIVPLYFPHDLVSKEVSELGRNVAFFRILSLVANFTILPTLCRHVRMSFVKWTDRLWSIFFHMPIFKSKIKLTSGLTLLMLSHGYNLLTGRSWTLVSARLRMFKNTENSNQ